MKLSNTTQFISERVKIKPITNAELDAARKRIEKENENIYVAAIGSQEIRDYIHDKNKKIEKFYFTKYNVVMLVPESQKDWFIENIEHCHIYRLHGIWRWWLGEFSENTSKEEAKVKLKANPDKFKEILTQIAGNGTIV